MTNAASQSAQPSGIASQRCINPSCGASFSIGERVYTCTRCSGPLEIATPLPPVSEASALRARWRTRAASLDPRDRSGVWRFREVLPFDAAAPIVTLGEGNTPLYDAPRCAQYSGVLELRLKHQGCNPTGSFKDTGMTTAVTQALVLGARTVVCASTGNTSASLAAYSARAGVQCAILLPRGQITSSKLAQSMDYGAIVCEIEGNFDDCMRLIQEIADDPSIYLANSINPFRMEGQKTVAYELMEQCEWRVPDHVIVPGGNMGNSSALGKGFDELHRMGLIDRLPKLSVIQAEGSAPLAHLFASLELASAKDESSCLEALAPVEKPQTLATAIKIGTPVSWKKALRSVLRSHGCIIAVSEQEIADAKAMIGRDGIGCEPASATTVAGIRKLTAAGFIRREESVVAVLTGHLLKDPDYVSSYHRGTLSLESKAEDGTVALLPIRGAFRNAPIQVAASKNSILEQLRRKNPKTL
ncbi:MAG TPA: threonine synthase [Candidatus Acidoferrales bacterium]|nr:threonine synthase [Candidatus Acidoferrales bacterium]